MQAQEVAPEKLFWGYGKDPQSLDEYYKRLKEQVNVILSMDYITGFCYPKFRTGSTIYIVGFEEYFSPHTYIRIMQICIFFSRIIYLYFL